MIMTNILVAVLVVIELVRLIKWITNLSEASMKVKMDDYGFPIPPNPIPPPKPRWGGKGSHGIFKEST